MKYDTDLQESYFPAQREKASIGGTVSCTCACVSAVLFISAQVLLVKIYDLLNALKPKCIPYGSYPDPAWRSALDAIVSQENACLWILIGGAAFALVAIILARSLFFGMSFLDTAEKIMNQKQQPEVGRSQNSVSRLAVVGLVVGLVSLLCLVLGGLEWLNEGFSRMCFV